MNIEAMFNVQEEKEFESKYLTPGLQGAGVKIDEISWEKGEGFSDGIKVKLSNQTGQILEDKFSFSPNAKKYSEQKMTHIWDRFYPIEDLKALTTQANGSMETFCALLNKKLAGKVFDDFKVSGKEIEGKEGKKNWFKGVIGLPSFCSTKAYPKVLKFDENNKYDMQRLTTNTTTEELSKNTTLGGASW